MFCPKCGVACEENAQVCSACGAVLQEQKDKYAKLKKWLETYLELAKEHWDLLLGTVSVVAVLLGLANLFCLLKVYRVAEVGLMSDRGFVTVGNAAKALRNLGGSFVLGIIGNVLFGIASLAAGATGALYFLKKRRDMDYYDKFVAKYIKTEEPAFLMGVAGAGGVALQVILYLLSGISKSNYYATVTVGIHWLNWLGFLMFALLAATAYLLKKK